MDPVVGKLPFAPKITILDERGLIYNIMKLGYKGGKEVLPLNDIYASSSR